MKKFLKSPYFWISVVLQIVGPYLVTFGNWANIIQYVSGFTMAFALFAYVTEHKKEMAELKELVWGLHSKHDKMHEKLEEMNQ